MNTKPILFSKKEECCGCGACCNICPQNALLMQEDECGFLYPAIDATKCVHCGLCKQACAFQTVNINRTPLECFAAVSKNEVLLQKSASGGIFAGMAGRMISLGGVVYGAAFRKDWSIHHEEIVHHDDIAKLQGSKYAQSDTERTYIQAKEQLRQGKKVLYSGTPCQIAGLLGFLGKRYENLITIDLVCHGVPSNRMLRDYLGIIEKKHGGKIDDFTFRDKTLGWGKNGSAVINGKKIKLWESQSSYFYYFAKSWINRESCYSCKYASDHRPGDITLGDYWGIEKQHPELFRENWNEDRGISCIIINTQRGKAFFDEMLNEWNVEVTSFRKIADGNQQLRHPSAIGRRDEILDAYTRGGWSKLDKKYKKEIGLKYFKSTLKRIIPKRIKRKLKQVLVHTQ